MRLLLIEDETELLHDLAKGLRLKGYAVDCAEDGELGLEKAEDGNYDLIVLDLNLPQLSGFELLEELRRHNEQTKVLILTADSRIESKLRGFDQGANDYLTKPFHFAELEARIRSLLHRQFVQRSVCLTYGNLELDTQKRIATIQNVEIRLTAKEFALLEYFMLNNGRVISQYELIEHVWDESVDMFSNSIRVHLSSLRKKLKERMGVDPILTKIGEGYLLP